MFPRNYGAEFFMHVLENWTLIRIICGIGVLLKGNHVVSYLALKWIYLMWVVDHKVILYCNIICEIRKGARNGIL
jgi:hypothetical protein